MQVFPGGLRGRFQPVLTLSAEDEIIDGIAEPIQFRDLNPARWEKRPMFLPDGTLFDPGLKCPDLVGRECFTGILVRHAFIDIGMCNARDQLAFAGINTWRGVSRHRPILTGKSYMRVGSIETGKMVIYPIVDNLEKNASYAIKKLNGATIPLTTRKQNSLF